MIPPIFRNESEQALFERDGFVKVPLLDKGQVKALADFFAQTRERHQTVQNLHHTTTDTQNTELIFAVDAYIKSVFTPALEKVLTDFKALAGTYHIKEKGEGSATGIHQDPTFVDESRFCSANVWVALHDIDHTNGNLYFVPGTHRAVSSLRITPSFPAFYDSFREALPARAVHVPLKAGEAVIFHNGTVHAATDNLTDTFRLAATLLVCSREAEWLLYYRNPADGRIGEYRLDMDAFAALSKNGGPADSCLQRYVEHEFGTLTREQFMAFMGAAAPKPGGFQKIKRLLGIGTSA